MSFLMCNHQPSLINELHEMLWFHSLPYKWLTVKTYTHSGQVGVTVPLLILLSVSRHQTRLFPVLLCCSDSHHPAFSSDCLSVQHNHMLGSLHTDCQQWNNTHILYVMYIMAKHLHKKYKTKLFIFFQLLYYIIYLLYYIYFSLTKIKSSTGELQLL